MTRCKPARNLQDVVSDMLWPQSGLCIDPEADRRHMAVARSTSLMDSTDAAWSNSWATLPQPRVGPRRIRCTLPFAHPRATILPVSMSRRRLIALFNILITMGSNAASWRRCCEMNIRLQCMCRRLVWIAPRGAVSSPAADRSRRLERTGTISRDRSLSIRCTSAVKYSSS